MIKRSTDRGVRGRRAPVSSEIMAHCRTVLQQLPWPSEGSLKTLGVTSCLDGEGVSTIAAQLAATAADFGRPVLLVDANLRHPSVHRTFKVDAAPGLVEVLADGSEIGPAIQSSSVRYLSILSAGKSSGDWDEAGSSVHFGSLIESVKNDFELTIFDMSAASQASSAIHMAGMLDGVLLVVEAERVRAEVGQRTGQLLVRANANILGAILNKRRKHVPDWLYRRL